MTCNRQSNLLLKHHKVQPQSFLLSSRAQLRSCLERLKGLVPATSDTSRPTTLSPLTRARAYISTLHEDTAALQTEKARLQVSRVDEDEFGSRIDKGRRNEGLIS